MRNDLLEAQACIDWAIAQLPILKGRLAKWLESRPYLAVTHKDAETGEETIQIEERQSIPLIINAETGVIINSIRSSLDVLANILAKRNGCVDPKDVRFPIARSFDAFANGKRGGRKAISALSPADQATIENLKPYQGGDDLLWALHHMDIMRKHRQLIVVNPIPRSVMVSRWGDSHPELEFINTFEPLKHGTVLALVPPGSDYKVKIRPEVTFSEAGILTRKPVTPSLGKMAGHAASIIKLFDIP
jgi:hypothetical protein